MKILVLPFKILKRILRLLRWKWLFGKRRRPQKPPRNQDSRIARWHRRLVWGMRIGLVLLALDTFYIITIWPNWHKFRYGPVAKSAFMKNYEQKRRTDRTLPPIQWQPVPITDISKSMQRAVVIAEDSRFYQHSGFDLIALKDAMGYNIERMSMRYGASTISQQVVKNMFFSASRDPLRKWHELIFTIGMEFFVPKSRILSTYLNIAEFGESIYGVEAAAKYYWGISARDLSVGQSVELAATLPSPKKHNPKTRTEPFTTRVNKIANHMVQAQAARASMQKPEPTQEQTQTSTPAKTQAPVLIQAPVQMPTETPAQVPEQAPTQTQAPVQAPEQIPIPAQIPTQAPEQAPVQVQVSSQAINIADQNR